MPLYEYKCENCKNIFERLATVLSSKEKIIECPECKKSLAHKIPSVFNSPSAIAGKDKVLKKDSKQTHHDGPIINMEPYSGITIDESVKNCEISNLTFKKDKTSHFSVHPKAKARIKNCKFKTK